MFVVKLSEKNIKLNLNISKNWFKSITLHCMIIKLMMRSKMFTKVVSIIKYFAKKVSTVLFFYSFQSLNLLDLSYNRLAQIDAGTFKGLPKLSSLDLSHNSQLVLEPNGLSFQGLEYSLLHLELDNVSLTQVRYVIYSIYGYQYQLDITYFYIYLDKLIYLWFII